MYSRLSSALATSSSLRMPNRPTRQAVSRAARCCRAAARWWQSSASPPAAARSRPPPPERSVRRGSPSARPPRSAQPGSRPAAERQGQRSPPRPAPHKKPVDTSCTCPPLLHTSRKVFFHRIIIIVEPLPGLRRASARRVQGVGVQTTLSRPPAK